MYFNSTLAIKVTPEYLQDICLRLFSPSVGTSVDVSKPGTVSLNTSVHIGRGRGTRGIISKIDCFILFVQYDHVLTWTDSSAVLLLVPNAFLHAIYLCIYASCLRCILLDVTDGLQLILSHTNSLYLLLFVNNNYIVYIHPGLISEVAVTCMLLQNVLLV